MKFEEENVLRIFVSHWFFKNYFRQISTIYQPKCPEIMTRVNQIMNSNEIRISSGVEYPYVNPNRDES